MCRIAFSVIAILQVSLAHRSVYVKNITNSLMKDYKTKEPPTSPPVVLFDMSIMQIELVKNVVSEYAVSIVTVLVIRCSFEGRDGALADDASMDSDGELAFKKRRCIPSGRSVIVSSTIRTGKIRVSHGTQVTLTGSPESSVP